MRTKGETQAMKWGLWLVVLNAVSAVCNAAYGNPAVAVFNVAMGALLAYQLATFPE